MNSARPKLLVVVAVLMAAIATFSVTARAETDYCAFSDKVTLLLVDRTTMYDDIDKTQLVSGLEQLYNALGIGDRLIVHTIADHTSASEKVFDGCYPGCPDEGLMGWIVSTCRAGLARSDLLTFREQLALRLREVLYQHEEYPHSAIIATLASTTARYKSVGLNRLVVFSDLLENSTEFPWPTIATRETQSLHDRLTGLGLSPVLHNVQVVAFGIGRIHDEERTPLTANQRSALLLFWRTYFANSGSASVEIGEWYQ